MKALLAHPAVKALTRWVLRWQNWLVGAALIAAVLAGLRLWPHQRLRTWLPSSTAVYDAKGRLLRLTLASDDRYRLWVPLKDISPQLVQGVLLHEDRWYRWHAGFNPYGLARGAWVTYVRHGNPQGGSTVTMQLARLLWRLNTRSPLGKLRQLGRAVQLELFYSKDEILEAYLNYAPYGRNVEGVGAASLAYFDQPPAALTLPEALTLAVVPQDPARRLRAGGEAADAAPDVINRHLADSRNRLYARWLQQHPADAALKPLFALPLNLRSLSRLPFEAPHAVEQLLNARRLEAGNTDSRVASTLDLDLQHDLERQVARYIERNQSRGVRNAAAILVDTRDMAIKAMIGSAGYGDAAIHGQVNGTQAKRSPGSTLKPFIYALGFDQGVLHPQTVLRDVPTSFGPYTPENFDGHFLGPVTATEALVRSRNIPAVWVASQLHGPSFYQFLREAGIGRLASEKHYGLALVLGGGEVTMQELAGLYAMLANRGELKPLRLAANDPLPKQGTRLLSEEASFMVMDMLRQNPRPDETTGAQPYRLPVYWKTGTSWGFRDAWTAGSFGPYVLVVWVGNFDGSSNPAFVGVEAAAPLFFQIVDALRAEQPGMAEPIRRMPANLKRVSICLASGELPNQWCPQKGTTWFIPGKSPIRVSQVHRPVVIDDATGKPACPPYDGKRTHLEVYEFWPSELQQVFIQAGIPRRTPPRNEACVNGGEAVGEPPRITSPLRGSIYALRLKRSDESRIAFSANGDAATRTLYWFVNDAYVGSSAPGQPLFWQPPAAGNYDVRVVDDRGMSDTRPLGVSLVE
ncbi:penicillin-binding protein 1C [Dyella sp. SG609]|uniref:penicillin-binding protein 1C n=1 Tax=Dyella sp. SG609 TaxID=2587018 RepID=UPI0014459A6D|nr:penicillin-binding protein 1C [Dyella sp. SG609]NKJ23674.1 penicillin-binding protein 1C [Dyella sp. SG609]